MPPENDASELEIHWKSLHPDLFEASPNARATSMGTPLEDGEIAIGRPGSYLVCIRADGTVRFEGDYNPDQAARDFWVAVGRARKAPAPQEPREGDVQAINQRVMEMLMLQLGRADLQCEQARLRASAEEASEHDKFRADLATRNLEAVAHTVIEYARGLAQAASIREPSERRGTPG